MFIVLLAKGFSDCVSVFLTSYILESFHDFLVLNRMSFIVFRNIQGTWFTCCYYIVAMVFFNEFFHIYVTTDFPL